MREECESSCEVHAILYGCLWFTVDLQTPAMAESITQTQVVELLLQCVTLTMNGHDQSKVWESRQQAAKAQNT